MHVNLWLIIAAIALLGGVFAHDHYETKRANREAAANMKLTADITAEKANRATEHADRRRADETVTSLQEQLDRINRPAQPVSVYCRPAKLPTATREGHAAASTDDPAIGDGAEGPLRDIGIAVDAVRREQQSNAARQRALMKWERERTH